jgi:hypothetical protein
MRTLRCTDEQCDILVEAVRTAITEYRARANELTSKGLASGVVAEYRARIRTLEAILDLPIKTDTTTLREIKR